MAYICYIAWPDWLLTLYNYVPTQYLQSVIFWFPYKLTIVTPFKGQHAYNILNVHVFVSIIQNEIEIDMEMDMEKTHLFKPLLPTSGPTSL